jgi:hypothetical protein
MSRFAAVFAVPMLLAQQPVPADVFEVPPIPDPASLEQLDAPHDEIVQRHVGIACGLAPPLSIAEWRERADAIVQVRIDSQIAYDHLIQESDISYVMTAHEATVLDVFKADRRAGAAGSSMTVRQYGGIIRRPDGLHAHHWNRFDIMPPQTEWVLFLSWNDGYGGFEVAHFEHGAFQILGETIVTAGSAPFAESWNGQSASAFLASLTERK